MNILVIGSGGREHALVWKLAQSPQAEKVYAIPGNPGIARSVDLPMYNHKAIIDFAREKNIELVVVGPEAPLVKGLVDDLTAVGIKTFGPSAKAAQLEGSKAFAKALMKKYNIPTAAYEVFTDAKAAKEYVKAQGVPIVIKADGLAAGKGVVVAMTFEEALSAIDDMLKDNIFDGVGSQVVIEEFMEGEEASVLAFSDGTIIRPMISAQDHKRAYDGDKGPNTGGMGTYAPAPVVTPAVLERVQKEILEPTVAAMKAEGIPYRGCLYAGLMITPTGPKVVEFNARFGDPEAQVVLPLLDGDLAEIMLACTADDKLAKATINWKEGAAVCVVMAAGGYPASYEKGNLITGIEVAEKLGAAVFHAGTKNADGKLVTNGGRVLGVTGVANSVADAAAKSYEAVAKISFKDAFCRKDIAYRAINR